MSGPDAPRTMAAAREQLCDEVWGLEELLNRLDGAVNAADALAEAAPRDDPAAKGLRFVTLVAWEATRELRERWDRMLALVRVLRHDPEALAAFEAEPNEEGDHDA